MSEPNQIFKSGHRQIDRREVPKMDMLLPLKAACGGKTSPKVHINRDHSQAQHSGGVMWCQWQICISLTFDSRAQSAFRMPATHQRGHHKENEIQRLCQRSRSWLRGWSHLLRCCVQHASGPPAVNFSLDVMNIKVPLNSTQCRKNVISIQLWPFLWLEDLIGFCFAKFNFTMGGECHFYGASYQQHTHFAFYVFSMHIVVRDLRIELSLVEWAVLFKWNQVRRKHNGSRCFKDTTNWLSRWHWHRKIVWSFRPRFANLKPFQICSVCPQSKWPRSPPLLFLQQPRPLLSSIPLPPLPVHAWVGVVPVFSVAHVCPAIPPVTLFKRLKCSAVGGE